VTLSSFVSPFKKWRQNVRRKHEAAEVPYFEVEIQSLFLVTKLHCFSGLHHMTKMIDSIAIAIPEK
jgi:hypothetical protein